MPLTAPQQARFDRSSAHLSRSRQRRRVCQYGVTCLLGRDASRPALSVLSPTRSFQAAQTAKFTQEVPVQDMPKQMATLSAQIPRLCFPPAQDEPHINSPSAFQRSPVLMSVSIKLSASVAARTNFLGVAGPSPPVRSVVIEDNRYKMVKGCSSGSLLKPSTSSRLTAHSFLANRPGVSLSFRILCQPNTQPLTIKLSILSCQDAVYRHALLRLIRSVRRARGAD